MKEKKVQIPIELVAKADDVLQTLKQLKESNKKKMEIDFIKKGSLKEDQVQIDRLLKRAEAFRKTLDNPDPKNTGKIATEYSKLLQELENISGRNWEIEIDYNKLREGNKEVQNLIKEIEELKTKASEIKIEPIKIDNSVDKQIEEVTEKLKSLNKTVIVPGGAKWLGLEKFSNDPSLKKQIQQEVTGLGSGKKLDKTSLQSKLTNLKNIQSDLKGQKDKKQEAKIVSDLIKQIETYIKDIQKAEQELQKLQTESGKNKLKQDFSKKANEYLKQGHSVKDLRKLAEEEGIINLTKTGRISTAKDNQTGMEDDYRAIEEQYNNALKNQASIQDEVNRKQEECNAKIEEAANKQRQYSENSKGTLETINGLVKSQGDLVGAVNKTGTEITKTSQQFDKARQTIARYTSGFMIFSQLRKIVHQAWQDIQEVDKQLNEISIVTGKTMDELWNGFGKINAVAQEYGVTASNVVSVQNLYYHQGRSVAEVNQLTAETLTLAKISGLDYADATDKMTAALNAYNIAAEDANRVTDVTAALASNAATSTEELMNALTKTASIAANAGMSIETTEVFLTKMIETTRESSENLGTALKTITARFTEMKSAVDVDEDGVVADFNKVETALKKAGVSLKDSSGSFRDIDDVFMDLSKAWDNLDRNTQRYIATQAAGSRQQSRFIAMIEDYDRTLELTQIAQDSAGTGAIQLARSQESIETAINKLKSSWQEFYTKVLNGNVFKSLITTANKLVNWLNEGNTALKTTAVILGTILAIKTAKSALDIAELAMIKRKADGPYEELLADKQILKTEIKRAAVEKIITGEITKQGLKQSFNKGKEVGAGAVKGAGKIATGGLKGAVSTLSTGAGAMVGVLTELLPILAVALPVALVAAGVAYGTFGKDMIENIKLNKKAKESIENLIKATDRYNTSLKELKDVKEKYNTYIELFNKGTAKSKEELEQFTNIQNELASVMPQMVDYYDAEGNAILKQKNELKELVDAKKEQVEVDKQIQQTAVRTGATAGVLTEGTKAGSSFKSLTEAAGGLSGQNYGQYAKGSDLSKKEINKGLEYLTNAKAFNAVTLGKLTGDTVTTDQFSKIAEAVQSAGKDEEDPVKRAEAQREAFKQALEDSGEYSDKKIDYLVQLNADLGNQLVNTFANLGDYIKEVKIQEAKINIASAMDEAGAGEATNVTEALQNVVEKQYKDFDAKLEGQTVKEQKSVKDIVSEIGVGIGAAVPGAMAGATGGAVGGATIGALVGNLPGLGIGTLVGAGVGAITGGVGSSIAAFEGQKALIEKNLEEYDTDYISGLVESYLGSTESIKEDLEKFENGNKQEYEALKALVESGDIDGVSTMEEYFNSLQESQEEYTKQSEEFAKEFGKLNKNSQTRINDILGQVETGSMDQTEAEKQIENILKASGIKKDSQVWEQLLGDGNEEAKLSILLNTAEEEKGKTTELIEKILNAYQDGDGYTIKINVTTEEDGNKTIDGINLTSEQLQSVFDIQSDLYSKYGQQAGADFLNTYFDYIRTFSEKDQQDVAKALGSLFAAENVESYKAAEKELNKLGIEISDIENLYIQSGKAGQLGFASVTDASEKLESTLEQVDNVIDDIIKALSGDLDLKGLSTLLNTFDNLSVEDFSATAEGFKLTGDSVNFEDYLDKTFEVYTRSTAEAMAQSSQDFLDTLTNDQATVFGGKKEGNWRKVSDKALEYAQGGTEKRESIIKSLIDDGFDKKEVTKFFDSYADQYQAILLNALAKEQKVIQQRVKAAEKELETWKNIISLIESFDRWANFDNLSKTLELQSSDYQAAIDAKINPSVTSRATTQLLGNITAQMAENLAEQKAAQEDAKKWEKEIKGKYSKYLTIGEDGNIQYTKEYYRLADKVSKGVADDKEIARLQDIKSNIDKVKDKYIEAYDRMMKAHTNYIKSLKEVRDRIKEQYQNIATMESKILSILQENNQKELDNYKKTIDKKKEAQNDYLNSIKEAIDKERSMRDLADQEEDLNKKERRLALLQMDTSGMYAGEIASLESEINKDRRGLEDTYVDNELDKMSKQIENMQEVYDRDITAWEDYLDWKKQDMTEYQEEIDDLLLLSQEQLTNWYKENAEEYKTATGANKEVLKLSFEEVSTSALSSLQVISERGFKNLEKTLNDLKTNGIEDIDKAIQTFADKAKTSIGGHKGSITSAANELNQEIDTGNDLILDLTSAWDGAETAAKNYYKVLKDIQDIDLSKVLEKLGAIMNDLKDINNLDEGNEKTWNDRVNSGAGAWYTNGEVAQSKTLKTFLTADGSMGEVNGIRKGKDGKLLISFNANEGSSKAVWWKVKEGNIHEKEYKEALGNSKAVIYKNKRWEEVKNLNWERFAKGGYVDYTGPAWVDGTKSNPEAFLDAQDTANIAALTDALQFFNHFSINTEPRSASTNSSNTFEININVDSIDNDYDVEQLSHKVQNEIYKNMTKNGVTYAG